MRARFRDVQNPLLTPRSHIFIFALAAGARAFQVPRGLPAANIRSQ